MSHGAEMITGFLTTLGAMAANKKIVGAWLIMLTLTIATIGDKVYVSRTEEMAMVKGKLESIEVTLSRIDATTQDNQKVLTQLLVEQARVRAQFEAHATAER